MLTFSDFYSQRLNEKFTSLLPATHLLSDVVVATKSEPAIQTWRTMRDKGIFGVPIVEGEAKRPFTIINMFNFASYFIDKEAAVGSEEILGNLTTGEMMGMISIGFSSNEPEYKFSNLLPVKQNNISFRKTCTMLTKSGCHSVALMKNKKLAYLITRASVIRFIAGTPTYVCALLMF